MKSSSELKQLGSWANIRQKALAIRHVVRAVAIYATQIYRPAS
jgi:hypothetical protein